MEPYHLLSIDPGSEESAFLYCYVKEPEEWALPFGVEPMVLKMLKNNPDAATTAWAFSKSGPGAHHMAIEVMHGIFILPGKKPKVVGRDQLETQFWAGVFASPVMSRGRRVDRVTRATATSVVTKEISGAKGDPNVRRALVDVYGGEKVAVGGGRCKTCKKAGGWIGRTRRDCPNCKAGHGATGFESPPGVFAGWTGSHGFAALAVAIVAAQRIG